MIKVSQGICFKLSRDIKMTMDQATVAILDSLILQNNDKIFNYTHMHIIWTSWSPVPMRSQRPEVL